MGPPVPVSRFASLGAVGPPVPVARFASLLGSGFASLEAVGPPDPAVDLGPVEGGDRGSIRVAAGALDQDEPGGVEPRQRHPLVQVIDGQAALLRVAGERGGVGRHPGLVVLARDERPREEPLGELDRRGVLRRERPPHEVELAHPQQPGCCGQGPCRGQVAVRPGVLGARRDERVEQRPADPLAPVAGADGQLGDSVVVHLPVCRQRGLGVGVRHPGGGHGIPDDVSDRDGTVLGEPEDERLGERGDAVGCGRPVHQLLHLEPLRRRQRARDLELDGAQPPLPSASARAGGSSGTNR